MVAGYLAIFCIGAAVGAFAQAWWMSYMEDTADERSIHRYEQARRCGNRWL